MSIKNRLLPIEIKHTVPNWGLVDYRKEEVEKWVAGSTYESTAQGSLGI
jgi:hypothetical protein